MISGLLPILVIVMYLVFRRARLDADGRQSRMPVEPLPRRDVTAELDEWRSAGLISADQVTAILDHERLAHPLPPPSVVDVASDRSDVSEARGPARPPITRVTEALGYLGGVLALVGTVLLVARYWTDLALAGRLGISGGAAVALFAVGWFVPEDRDAALARLRWFLWLVSSGAVGAFGGILADHLVDAPAAADGDVDIRVPMAVALAVAVQNAPLWWRRERPVQQVAFLVAVSVTVGTAAGHVWSSGAAGSAVWVVGAVGVVLGLRHLTPVPILTLAVGAMSAFIGGQVMSGSWMAAALVMSTATVAMFAVLATLESFPTSPPERLVLGVVAGLGAFASLAPTIGYFSERSAVATGLVVWSIGVTLLMIADRGWLRGPMGVAVLGAIGWIGGAAITGVDLDRAGPLFAVLTALAAIWAGVLLDRFPVSVVGAAGLLGTVPWAVIEWFPGEGRAPLLIMVSGGLILVMAFVLTRLHGHRRPSG